MSDLTELANHWSRLPRIYTVRASGDGQWVFWSWEALHESAEIYAMRTDGTGMPERLTYGSDHFTVRGVSHDGMRLILAQSVNGSEHDQLLLLERSKSNALTALTPVQFDHFVYGGSFSPDGGSIIFMADFDYAAGRVTDGGWMYRQDLTSGKRSVLIRTKSSFTDGPKQSPDGAHILWHRHERSPGGDQIWLMRSDGSDPREVLNEGGKARIAAVWLDDASIGFVAQGLVRDWLGTVDIVSGQVRLLVDEVGFDPWEIVAGRGNLACHAFRDSVLETVLFDEKTGTRSGFANNTGRRSALPLQSLSDGSWIVEAYDADAPHEIFRVTADGRANLLAKAPVVAGRRFARPSSYHWNSPDGTPVQGWLYQPDCPSKGLVVWVHGGPTWHSEDWANPKVQFYVAAGYTVLDPNYRGSTGFGMRFREAVKDDGWGGREQDDIRSGIEALVRDGLAEHGKIAVIGLSFGGYSSWVAITRFADLVNAAVPICGMYRLDIDYHATEMPHGRDYSKEMMGGTPEQLGEKYRLASPGNYIDAIKGCLMIVHGLADSNVGPQNTHVAIRELTAKGIAHEVLLFENEGHGVTKQSNLVTFMLRTAEFLARAFAK